MALTNKLSSIGDAIRSKTGKGGKLTLDQMVTEIQSISGGGGDNYLGWYNALCNATEGPYEWSIDFDQEYIPALSNYYGSSPSTQLNLTKCNLPNLKRVAQYALGLNSMNSKSIDYVELPEVTRVDANAFTNFYVTTLSLPKCETFQNFMSACISNFYLPRMYSTINGMFQSTQVKCVYCGDALSTIGGTTTSNSPFRNCYYVEKLIVDKATPPTLNTYLINYAHNNASNRFYNGSAFIYVPKSAMSAYASATNWSVYYAAGGIKAIEDSQSELAGIFPALDEKMGW